MRHDTQLSVLIAGPVPPPVGGVTGFVALLTRCARAHGHRVDVYDTSTHSEVADTGVWSARNAMRAIGLLARFALRIRRQRPSVVQVEAAGYLGLLKSSGLSLAAGTVPVVLSIHSPTIDRDFKQARWVGKLIIRPALRRAAAIRCMNPAQVDRLTALVPDLPADKVHVVRPFIEPAPRGRKEASRSGSLRAVSVGAVGVRKGTFELLAAVAQLRSEGIDVTCEIIGPEERKGELTALRRERDRLGLRESVRLSGFLCGDEVRGRLENADVFVLPSRAEGLPLALLEAMSMGLPVAVTDVGAIGETVEQPELPPFPPEDHEALCLALRTLALDPRLRDRCGEANLARVRSWLSPNVVLPAFVQLWQDAAENRRHTNTGPSQPQVGQFRR